MALFEEIIVGQCQLKWKENQDVNQLTEMATLKINETNKIKELYKIIGEFTESEKEKQMKERQKFEEEWKEMEAINNSQKVNQTDQLEALRFKMKAKIHNLSQEKSEQAMGNEMPGMRKRNPKRNTKQIWGFSTKIEIGAIGKHGTFIRIPFSEIPEGGI